MSTPADFNPLSPETRADPYPAYRRLREEDPVHRSPESGVWFLTRYADCLEMLVDPRFSAERRRAASAPALSTTQYPSMLTLDPPDHTRLRKLVNLAFTPRMVKALTPRIEQLVDELLEAAAGRGSIELIDDFAYPLPVTVIAEMLGVPAEDRARFQAWSPADMTGSRIDPGPDDPLMGYFGALIADRRRRPRADFLTDLMAADMTETELLAMCYLILLAGHETTVNLIGNGTLALIRHPGEMIRLRSQPNLIDTAVEEFLRYDAPVQLTSRVATEDVDWHGHRIAALSTVVGILGAANRDPAIFENPEELDVARAHNPHLGFGRGLHFCLGAPLARLIGRIAFNQLLARFPDLRLAGEPELRRAVVVRGLRRLPVEF